MSSKSRRKKNQSSSRPIRRARGSVAPAISILVVTEGTVTEPTYFIEFRNRFKLLTVEIVVEGSGCGDPKVLAERALEEQRKRKLNARKGLLSIAQVEAFDQLWIVFDTDALKSDKLHNGISFAKSNGVRYAQSTPCFEFWLLLHLHFTTAPMADCAEVIKWLEKVLGRKYSKKRGNFENLIPQFVTEERIQNAIKNTQLVRRHHKSALTQFPCDPSTDVDFLVGALTQTASPAKKKFF